MLLKGLKDINFVPVIFFGYFSSHRSRQYLLIGLIFSSIGDILLNHDLFPEGMGAFAVAQAFYIASFGFKPLKPIIGIVLYCVGAAGEIF